MILNIFCPPTQSHFLYHIWPFLDLELAYSQFLLHSILLSTDIDHSFNTFYTVFEQQNYNKFKEILHWKLNNEIQNIHNLLHLESSCSSCKWQKLMAKADAKYGFTVGFLDDPSNILNNVTTELWITWSITQKQAIIFCNHHLSVLHTTARNCTQHGYTLPDMLKCAVIRASTSLVSRNVRMFPCFSQDNKAILPELFL